MFPYYGRKKMLAPLYPAPEHGTIVEPFAGSAQYAMRHHDRDVVLIDRDPIIVAVWEYLIAATPDDIMALPIPNIGEKVSGYTQLSEVERWFIGYWVNRNASSPRDTVRASGGGNRRYSCWNPRAQAEVAKLVPLVSHWRASEGDFTAAPDIEATWFFDPPYQGNGGKYYRFANDQIDYGRLGEWALSRNGQVIVCENDEADWLPFEHLSPHRGQTNRRNSEVLFHRPSSAAEEAA